MGQTLTVISPLLEDLELGSAFAQRTFMKLENPTDMKVLRKFVVGARPSLVLWNIDPGADLLDARNMLVKSIAAERLIAISQSRLSEYPDVLSTPIYDHHFVRNISEASLEMYQGVMNGIVNGIKMPTLQQFFGEGTNAKLLTVSDSRHKVAAITALEKHMKQLGLAPRLASLIRQAVDELLLNAIFDAPIKKDGSRYKWAIPRHKPIQLDPNEAIELEFAATEHSIAISVTDQFGSLREIDLKKALSEHYVHQSRPGSENASETATGMGLRGIYNAGLSLHCAVYPGHKTRITVFAPRASSFKDFRQGAQFLSINYVD